MTETLRILAVDDNEINQMIIQEILTQEGFKVTLAENGQCALDELSEHTFDLVLMDIQMPFMDGLAAIKEIRQLPPLKRLDVIALTGDATQEDIDTYLSVGFTAFIAKPFTRETLICSINEVLHES